MLVSFGIQHKTITIKYLSIVYISVSYILDGGSNHLGKLKVNGKDDIPYIVEIKFRFETTNQYIYI